MEVEDLLDEDEDRGLKRPWAHAKDRSFQSNETIGQRSQRLATATLAIERGNLARSRCAIRILRVSEAAKDEELACLRLSVVNKDKDLDDMQERVVNLDHELACLRKIAADRKQDLDSLRCSVVDKDRESTRLRETVAEYEGTLERVRKERGAWIEEADMRQQKLDRQHDSLKDVKELKRKLEEKHRIMDKLQTLLDHAEADVLRYRRQAQDQRSQLARLQLPEADVLDFVSRTVPESHVEANDLAHALIYTASLDAPDIRVHKGSKRKDKQVKPRG